MSKTIPSPNDIEAMPPNKGIDFALQLLEDIGKKLRNLPPISTMDRDDLVATLAFLNEAHFRVRTINRAFSDDSAKKKALVSKLSAIITKLYKQIRTRALELGLNLLDLLKEASEKLPTGTPPFNPEGPNK